MDALDTGLMAMLGANMAVSLIFAVIGIVIYWKIFSKAGKPGWAAIVPIYNIIVFLEIINKPIWWIIMMFIPFVNIVFAILMCIELAKCFGKDTGFAIGLILLSIIFGAILAFGSAEYTAPVVETPQA